MLQRDDCIGAVDIGGTKIAVGLVTRQGAVLSQRSFPTASTSGWERGVEQIAAKLDECCEESGLRVKTVGVGCTGPIDPLSGVVGRVSLLPAWEGCHLTATLAKLTGAKVAMENDADAAALGELAWGSGRGARRFLYVTISTGIGAGFICNGELYRGANGVHPEMGHHTIDSLGPPCYCGARGCWESLASGTAIERRFAELRREAGIETENVGAEPIFKLAQGRDPIARVVIDQFLRDLGTGLANVVTMLVPDVIALGGGVMSSVLPHLPAIQQFVQQRCGEVPVHGTVLRAAELGSAAGLVGASAVAIARWK